MRSLLSSKAVVEASGHFGNEHECRAFVTEDVRAGEDIYRFAISDEGARSASHSAANCSSVLRKFIRAPNASAHHEHPCPREGHLRFNGGWGCILVHGKAEA